MLQNMNKIHFLTGNIAKLESAFQTSARPTWDDRTVDFLGAFSRNLLKHSRSKAFPDITSYAFWIRNASLRQIKEHYYQHVEDKLGRGLAFHVAPSNVPINFAVSFTSSLLAGNSNVVRVSNKEYEQVPIMVECLKKTFLEGFEDMENYLILIQYEHDEDITQYISSICDIRIIWGGDRTIATIRKATLPPRAVEMTFADRYSIAMLNSDRVVSLDSNEIQKLAADFYTDTYYIDQNACSSPRIVVWYGNQIEQAKKLFWSAVEILVNRDYDFKDIQAIDKMDQFCKLAAANNNVRIQDGNNAVIRIDISEVDGHIMNYKLGGGYFFEYKADTLEELIPIFDKSCQTISYFGMNGNEIQDFVMKYGLRGCDRIVPIGKTMDLTFKWDGYDMIETMSRYVYCPAYKHTGYSD